MRFFACSALLSAAGVGASVLELRGSGSAIEFDAGANLARLTASCDADTAGWVWMAPRNFVGTGPTYGNISVVFTKVLPTCANVHDAATPCAADSHHVPPLFYCKYTGAVTNQTVGPVHAETELVQIESHPVAMRISAACPVPSYDTVLAISGYGGSGADVVLNVSVLHFAPSGPSSNELAFRGVPGHNSLRFTSFPTPPLSPPPPPPPRPPSVPPPPSPPAVGPIVSRVYGIGGSSVLTVDYWNMGHQGTGLSHSTSWTATTSMPSSAGTGITYVGNGVEVDGFIYIVQGSQMDVTMRLDPRDNSWSEEPAARISDRANHVVGAGRDGTIYALGGDWSGEEATWEYLRTKTLDGLPIPRAQRAWVNGGRIGQKNGNSGPAMSQQQGVVHTDGDGNEWMYSVGGYNPESRLWRFGCSASQRAAGLVHPWECAPGSGSMTTFDVGPLLPQQQENFGATTWGPYIIAIGGCCPISNTAVINPDNDMNTDWSNWANSNNHFGGRATSFNLGSDDPATAVNSDGNTVDLVFINGGSSSAGFDAYNVESNSWSTLSSSNGQTNRYTGALTAVWRLPSDDAE